MKKNSSTIDTVKSDSLSKDAAMEGWTFLTNHTHVLLCLYHNPDRRLRDVAQLVGITERMVQKVVADLAAKGYLHITKEGRCNHYVVDAQLKLRHPLEMHHTVGELLDLLRPVSEKAPSRASNRKVRA